MRKFVSLASVALIAIGIAAPAVAASPSPKGDVSKVDRACADFAEYPLPVRLEAVIHAWGPSGTRTRTEVIERVVPPAVGTPSLTLVSSEKSEARFDARGNYYEKDELGEFIHLNGMAYNRYKPRKKFEVEKERESPTGPFGISLQSYDLLKDGYDLALLAGPLSRVALQPDGSLAWDGYWGSVGTIPKPDRFFEATNAIEVSSDCRTITRTVRTYWAPVIPAATPENFREAVEHLNAVVTITIHSGPLSTPIQAPAKSKLLARSLR